MKHRKGSERSRRDALVELHGSLDRRYRPEDVAELVLEALAGRLSVRERLVLGRAARHSSRGSAWFTSMSSDYARPVGGARQVATATRLFGAPAEVDPDDPDSLLAYAGTVGRTIEWTPDRTDFLADRLNREAREAPGWTCRSGSTTAGSACCAASPPRRTRSRSSGKSGGCC
ncbi:hypothetical protein [Microbispora sp. GKU 823]|uniref:hypothetical protein n=1 Tax=Microbispora sp. GKU 823 TaxID=1652100 RepID=UPI0015C489E5|nr:hypothetical protein [Microbispora sp. GKU 823]